MINATTRPPKHLRSKPELRPELEALFVDIDKRSAECYTAFEGISYSLDSLAERLLDEKPGAVMAPILDNDSLVFHVEQAKQVARDASADDDEDKDA